MNPRLVFLQTDDKRAWVYPEQGFQLHGFEQDMGSEKMASMIFTPEMETEPADRRYGNPVLFPNPGACHSPRASDAWEWKDQVFGMPFHGFARNVYWHMVDFQPDRVMGELSLNHTARLAFPFNFRLRLTYRLEESGLVLDAELKNLGKEAFPYALGFHPYIRAPLGFKGSVAEASVVIPNGVRLESKDEWRTFQGKPFASRRAKANEDLSGSIILTESKAKSLELLDETNGWIAKVSVESSQNDFPVWVIWSASPDSPYVCLEPWTDIPNALNRRETRQCPPGQTHRYQMVLSVRKA